MSRPLEHIPRTKTARAATAFAAYALAAQLLGCQTKGVFGEPELSLERMIHQNKYLAYDEHPLFVDHRAMRPPPQGTVPRGALLGHLDVTHGLDGDDYVRHVPVPITRALLDRGRQRFETHCGACHGLLGDGDSVVAKQMLLVPPPNLLEDRIRSYPPGRVYRVVREGFGLMPSYAADLSIEERWAVVAYLLVLQRSQGVNLGALPPELRGEAQQVLR